MIGPYREPLPEELDAFFRTFNTTMRPPPPKRRVKRYELRQLVTEADPKHQPRKKLLYLDTYFDTCYGEQDVVAVEGMLLGCERN